MPIPDNRDLILLVRQWLEKARADMELARFLSNEGTKFLDAICFNCQQAAEKYLKAYLTHRQIPFPKTHDLSGLLGLIEPVDRKLVKGLLDVPKLSPYGVEIRYPGDAPKATASETKSALFLAGKTERNILAALSPAIRPKTSAKSKNPNKNAR